MSAARCLIPATDDIEQFVAALLKAHTERETGGRMGLTYEHESAPYRR